MFCPIILRSPIFLLFVTKYNGLDKCFNQLHKKNSLDIEIQNIGGETNETSAILYSKMVLGMALLKVIKSLQWPCESQSTEHTRALVFL